MSMYKDACKRREERSSDTAGKNGVKLVAMLCEITLGISNELAVVEVVSRMDSIFYKFSAARAKQLSESVLVGSWGWPPRHFFRGEVLWSIISGGWVYLDWGLLHQVLPRPGLFWTLARLRWVRLSTLRLRCKTSTPLFLRSVTREKTRRRSGEYRLPERQKFFVRHPSPQKSCMGCRETPCPAIEKGPDSICTNQEKESDAWWPMFLYVCSVGSPQARKHAPSRVRKSIHCILKRLNSSQSHRQGLFDCW